ncbi:MAG: Ig-like domain-containing protein [Lachnospiraceae bacterium]|nr:Ig-like domain-containing protein [Lachnospiraceae bacterium]
MRMKKRIIRGTAFFLALVMSALIAFSGVAFADDACTDEYGNYVEWWNFRNTDTNNAVTDRPTPTNDKEAWGKWATVIGKPSEYSMAPTPPIIVNGKLYVGAGNQVIELDKETGTILRRSEEMPGNVGYAMQSPVYADGKIFVAITSGRIAAINISDMSLAWTTDNADIIRGQTVSPISYVKINGTGYVYTGTWTKDGGDLICASTDDNDVDSDKIKKLTWHFNPQIEDAENLDANDSVAFGYYWTGAYVTEKYLAIGSDNGSTMGYEVDDTAFYTLDPLTGEIIDAVYGIKGQVRSTAVYENGHLYFSTKGGKVYKIPVDEDGNMGEPSYIDLNEYGASATTATVVVYGGKIYLGVQGKGNQFNADGGHGFAVIKDDEVLSQGSFVYLIPVPGNPQAGALLSDYHVEEDFDGDSTADGRVYLFFTYNALPGGIFYTYDTPDQTEPTKLTLEESRIFVPTGSQQQYCISSIVVDEDGVLYYKNDSCYLFAVESNPASLSGLEVFDESGEAMPLNQEFQSKLADYKVTAESEAASVSIKLTLEDDVSATVDGVAYTGDAMQIYLTENNNEIEILTNKNGKSRRYLLTVVKASVNCDLSALGSAINNNVPSTSNPNTRTMEPALSTDVTEYTFDWITTGTGASTGTVDPATKKMMNIFLKTESDKATVKVYAGENVDPEKVLEDGSIQQYTVSGNTQYELRFPVYSADVRKDSTARIVVTAEDGYTTKEYQITFSRRIYVSEVSLDQEEAELEKGETLKLTASVLPEFATDPKVVWSSSDETVATVDEEGVVTAVGGGTATIKAATEDGPYAECMIIVPIEWKEGWNQVDGSWYFYTNGDLAKGWKKVGSVWYYFDKETGVMQTGWVKDGNTWYYMKPSGAMATGWVKDGNNWYYMKSSGAMMTGWLKDGSTWYFMKSSGAMAANEWCDGYWLNANGSWTYEPRGSWKKDSVGWWFGDTSGWYAKNTTQKINNVNYTFDAAGYLVE